MDEGRQDISTSSPAGEAPSNEVQSVVQAKESTAPRIRRRLLSFLKTLLFAFVIALLLRTFVIEAFRIPSGSMENTLLVGDFLLVNKLAYGLKTPRYIPLTNVAIPSFRLPFWGEVRRGDVVVFEYPGKRSGPPLDEPSYYIKRCIGVPGDTVLIHTGRLMVNGREVLPPSHAKPYSFSESPFPDQTSQDSGVHFDGNNYGPIVVPKKGERVHLSATSARYWKSFVEREHHRFELDSGGKIIIDGVETSDYVLERNYFFMLGDNRGNSLDSRFWGYVPDDYVIGEALVVYWSWFPESSGDNVSEMLSNIRWNRIGTLIR